MCGAIGLTDERSRRSPPRSSGRDAAMRRLRPEPSAERPGRVAGSTMHPSNMSRGPVRNCA